MELWKDSMRNKIFPSLLVVPGIIIFIFYNTGCFQSDTAQGGLMKSDNKSIKERFISLYDQWQGYIQRPEIKISSRSQDYINCSVYANIVELGKPVLPYLIQELEDGKNLSWNDGQFFLWYAVREISGIDLTRPDEVISEQEVAERYIKWWEATKEE